MKVINEAVHIFHILRVVLMYTYFDFLASSPVFGCVIARVMVAEDMAGEIIFAQDTLLLIDVLIFIIW